MVRRERYLRDGILLSSHNKETHKTTMPIATSEELAMSNEKVNLDLPSDLIESGQILLIEKASEIFIDGYHLPQLTNPIRETQHFCLYRGDQQDQRFNHSSTSKDKYLNDDQQYFQLLVEVTPAMLDGGTSIEIEQQAKSTNKSSADLSSKGLVRIGISPEDLQRGKIFFIEQINATSMKIDKDPTKVSHHLHENFFTRRDHLQSKGLMQIHLKVDPEFFLNANVLIVKKEDLKSLNEHFAYRRPSKVHLDEVKNVTMDEFLGNAIEWDPVLLNDGHLLRLTLQLNETVEKEEQLKIEFDHQTLKVKIFDVQEKRFDVYRQVQLPLKAKADQQKVHFDRQHHSIQLTFPLQ